MHVQQQHDYKGDDDDFGEGDYFGDVVDNKDNDFVMPMTIMRHYSDPFEVVQLSLLYESCDDDLRVFNQKKPLKSQCIYHT